MKQYLLLFFILFISKCVFAQSDFVIHQMDNTYYISHTLKEGETLYQLARDYSIKSSLIENFNLINYQKGLMSNKVLYIPLTETNYFKMDGLSEEKGFKPLMYQVGSDETKEDIIKKFQIQASSFKKWNNGTETKISAGKPVIVGWFKYNENTSQPVESNSLASEPNAILNPRYIDPSKLTTAKTIPVYKRYVANTPVKKEIQAIKDDSRDVLAKSKTIIKSKKGKNNRIPDSNQEEVDVVKKEDVKELPSTNNVEIEKVTANTTEIPSKYKKGSSKANAAKKGKGKVVLNDFKKSFKENNKEKKKALRQAQLAKPSFVKNDPNRNSGDGSKSKKVWRDFRKSFKEGKTDPSANKYQAKDKSYTSKSKSVSNSKNIKKKDKEVESISGVGKEDNKPEDEKEAREITINKNHSSETKIQTKKSKKTNQKAEKNETSSLKELPPTKTTNQAEKTANKKHSKSKPIESQNETSNSKVSVEEVDAANIIDTKKAESVISKIENKTTANLENSKSGKASYFFSGPSWGKVYVATNIAPIGQDIKIINPINGKFVIAEVLSTLPSSDVAKGLIMKISDNAKSVLEQNNSSFEVKVNY